MDSRHQAAPAGPDTARSRLVLLRAEYAGLLAGRGQLPPAGARPLHVVADARAALCLTGWPA